VGTGAGLGLSICHSIVTSMGGEIAVESQLGRGTTVRVSLPASERRKEVSRTREGKAPPRRARILVVDDEPLVGSVIQRLLSPSHEVIAISRAQEALSLVGAGARFDVILCDLVMPHLTGVQLYAALRERGEPCAERMVFMTGGAFTDEARRFLAQVACPRIEKPFDIHALRALVRDLVEGAAAGS